MSKEKKTKENETLITISENLIDVPEPHRRLFAKYMANVWHLFLSRRHGVVCPLPKPLEEYDSKFYPRPSKRTKTVEDIRIEQLQLFDRFICGQCNSPELRDFLYINFKRIFLCPIEYQNVPGENVPLKRNGKYVFKPHPVERVTGISTEVWRNALEYIMTGEPLYPEQKPIYEQFLGQIRKIFLEAQIQKTNGRPGARENIGNKCKFIKQVQITKPKARVRRQTKTVKEVVEDAVEGLPKRKPTRKAPEHYERFIENTEKSGSMRWRINFDFARSVFETCSGNEFHFPCTIMLKLEPLQNGIEKEDATTHLIEGRMDLARDFRIEVHHVFFIPESAISDIPEFIHRIKFVITEDKWKYFHYIIISDKALPVHETKQSTEYYLAYTGNEAFLVSSKLQQMEYRDTIDDLMRRNAPETPDFGLKRMRLSQLEGTVGVLTNLDVVSDVHGGVRIENKAPQIYDIAEPTIIREVERVTPEEFQRKYARNMVHHQNVARNVEPLSEFVMGHVINYLDDETDLVNLMQTCKEYGNFNETLLYNPVTPIRPGMYQNMLVYYPPQELFSLMVDNTFYYFMEILSALNRYLKDRPELNN